MDKLLRHCGFSARLQGYKGLKECVKVVLDDSEKLNYITAVYVEVAQKMNLSWNGLERNIRTSIERAWNYGGQAEMEKIAGAKLYNRPTTGDMIEMIVFYIMDHPGEVEI